MPTATLPVLTTDQIDDLLYLARLGETADLKAGIDLFAKSLSTNPSTILSAAVDSDSGNGLLHMAVANGHTDTLKELLTMPASNHAFSLNLQNASGNTPLHWAALNGHLLAVQLLMEAGADPTVLNKAGKDAVYEAETGGKDEVATWLLTEGKGLESVIGSGPDSGPAGSGVEADAEGRLEEVLKEGETEQQH